MFAVMKSEAILFETSVILPSDQSCTTNTHGAALSLVKDTKIYYDTNMHHGLSA